jgi:DNA-binding FadR family transcriptional regulator
MFVPVEQLSLTDIVEEKIYSYLKEKHYKPGSPFPGETELAEMLQVSRPVLREALSRLRMLGLIQSKKRRGIVVSKPLVFETMKKIIDPVFLSPEEQRDFFNLRLTIELGLADILLLNIKSEDITELESIVTQEESEPSDFKFYMRKDYEFHVAIYKATKCASLESFQRLLYCFFSDITTRRKNAHPNFSNRFDDPEQITHRDVLEAIKTDNPEILQKAMREHLRKHISRSCRSINQ